MKVLFWILFLANAIFFAVMQWGWLLEEQAAKPQPVLHEEKINLMSAPPDILPTVPASAVAAALVAPKCMEWGDFSGAKLKRATAALSALQLGDKLSRRQVESAVNYWVYIPPIKNRVTLDKQITLLKAHGIDDYFVVTKPSQLLNAISLGVFRTQEAAQHFLDDLQHTKDVHNAIIGEKISKINAVRFVLNGIDARVGADIINMQKDFAGSELNETPCALTR